MASKQLKREGINEDNTEVFMTEEYKKKLADSKEFEKLQSLEEEYNNIGTVQNKVSFVQEMISNHKSDMSVFFKEMYKNDMVFGGPKIIEGAEGDQGESQNRGTANKPSLEDYVKLKL